MFRSLSLIVAVVLPTWYVENAHAQQKGSREAANIINRFKNESARAPGEGMLPASFKVGEFGKLAQGNFFFFKVDHILSKTEMVVVPIKVDPGLERKLWDLRFVVQGVPTDGLVDGKQTPLDGMFKVAGTKAQSGRTMFVLEAESAVDRAKREATEAAKVREAEEARAKAEQSAEDEKTAKAKATADKLAVDAPKRTEAAASSKLELARQLLDAGKRDGAKLQLERLIKDYPNTTAAKEATALLKKL